jgi:hypothetical protein
VRAGPAFAGGAARWTSVHFSTGPTELFSWQVVRGSSS